MFRNRPIGQRAVDRHCNCRATLVEPARTFCMLHECMQGNFLKNIENSGIMQGKIL